MLILIVIYILGFLGAIGLWSGSFQLSWASTTNRKEKLAVIVSHALAIIFWPIALMMMIV